MKWSVIDGKPAWLVTGDYASLCAACLAQGQGQPGGIDITVDLARFRSERPEGGRS